MTDTSDKIFQAAAKTAGGAWGIGRAVLWIRTHVIMSSFVLMALFMALSGNISEFISLAMAAVCLRYLYISPLRLFRDILRSSRAQ